MTNSLHKWHRTKLGLIVFCLIELAVFYVILCYAIDHGNPLYYLLALIFLVGGLKNLAELLGKLLGPFTKRLS
jgi:hypothetical protein